MLVSSPVGPGRNSGPAAPRLPGVDRGKSGLRCGCAGSVPGAARLPAKAGFS